MIEFTFILLTKGRVDIVDNIYSYLNLINKDISISLIIIDGNKDDRVQNIIKENFKNYPNIKIIKQKKGKFVRSCIEGLSYLKTNYFTFIYDDDYVSPYFSTLIELAHKNKTCVIGNGIVVSKSSSKFNFLKINNIVRNENFNFLKKYFCSGKISGKYLPASPACSVFKKDIISLWIDEIKEIFSNKFAFYYILHKNIGQDLLLYLISTFHKKNIMYVEDYSAQFTGHGASMSVKYGSSNLGVGYWLTKKVYFMRIKKNLNPIDKIVIKINLSLRGIKLAIEQQFSKLSFRKHSSRKLWKEIIEIIIK